MSDAPPADFAVDESLAARLVAAQHPDLSGEVRLVANGWDNAMFRLGDRLVVRMPRRREAVQLMWNQQRWLPELAPHLPVAVPAPVRNGRPAPELGYDVLGLCAAVLAATIAVVALVVRRPVTTA